MAVRGGECHGRLSYRGTLYAPFGFRDSLPMERDYECCLCGSRISVGIYDGRVFEWTREEIEAEERRIRARRQERRAAGRGRRRIGHAGRRERRG